MDISQKILSDVIVYSNYARYIPELKRRETWEEIVSRNMTMHIKKFPKLRKEIREVYEEFVATKKVLPSMRSMQFGGKPIELSPNRIYNCAYLPVDHYEAFSEIMFLLLGGTGIGYSVQFHHIDQLLEVRKPIKKRRYLIGDSIEGWADAVKVLVKSYFCEKSLPDFDYSDIRPKGARLKTSGGIAPGPEPLKDCLHNVSKVFERKENGTKLTSLEVHDIVCYIADAVLAGGIRRAALISLFSFDDEDMLTCKFGKWWELNPQRARANNSAVIMRHRIREKKFFEFWEKIKNSKSGEPGFFFSNNRDYGANPCAEISLRNNQFCNLVEINASDVGSQEDLNDRSKAAAFIATLQASYTNFHYLREIWKSNTEKDALIGVGMTGIASGKVLELDLKESSNLVIEENKRVAALLEINAAERTTTVKPSGTSSLVLGCSSGIHPWHSKFYIRRKQILKNEPLYIYLKKTNPKLVEDDYFKPHLQAVVSIPQKAPGNAITRYESVFDMLERVKKFNLEWVRNGHNNGDNTNNVSATISINDNEWDNVGEWMWENRKVYNGLAVFPKEEHDYVQAPFQEIEEETFLQLLSNLKDIDLTKVEELDDYTTLKAELACANGGCDVL